METISIIAAIVIVALFAIPTFALAIYVRGYVAMHLWQWFITDQFGVPAITIAHAIGIILTIRMATHTHVREEEDKRTTARKITEAIIVIVIAPFFTLLTGYIIRFHYMP